LLETRAWLFIFELFLVVALVVGTCVPVAVCVVLVVLVVLVVADPDTGDCEERLLRCPLDCVRVNGCEGRRIEVETSPGTYIYCSLRAYNRAENAFKVVRQHARSLREPFEMRVNFASNTSRRHTTSLFYNKAIVLFNNSTAPPSKECLFCLFLWFLQFNIFFFKKTAPLRFTPTR
jgi:hypothetical protein